MCAIIGSIGRPLTRETFARARDTMKHRGPNDAGIFIDEQNKIALGHCRLSIIDLSPLGHQPMLSPDGRYILTFNGEIFNYIELKKELSDYLFRSQSDTEVLLAAYIRFGKDCVKKFNGQFAFAIYDTKEKTLFAARDHLGIKPLFYHKDGQSFSFASEIKALLALGVPTQQNDEVIYDYLKFGLYDHSSDTFFAGIKMLPPGTSLTLKNDTLTFETYWDLSITSAPPAPKSFPDAETGLKTLIEDAVRLQFRSDVPVGLNLTSGLDSGTLFYFSKQFYAADMHTFTSCIPDPAYNECTVLEKELSATDRKLWHSITLEPKDVFSLASELMAVEDQPYGGMPAIQYYNLYKNNRTGSAATVIIEGQGVDEILGGYKYYYPAYLRDALRNFDMRLFKPYFRDKKTTGTSYLKTILELFSLPKNMLGRSQDMTTETHGSLLADNFEKEFAGRTISFPRPFKSELQNEQYRDIRYTKIPRILRSNDHMSMAFSKELRVPYLDRRIVEYCFFLPPTYKINGLTQKYLLRKAMTRHIPDALKRRWKVTFGAFQTEWLRRYFRKEVENLIASESFKKRVYWNHTAVETAVSKFFAGEGNNSFFLWQIINIELWLRKYID